MASPVRVVIAEDNYLVREGTRRLLEDSGEVEVVAAVGTASELIDAVATFLKDEVSPTLSGRLAFHARVAVNVLELVKRELALGPAAWFLTQQASYYLASRPCGFVPPTVVLLVNLLGLVVVAVGAGLWPSTASIAERVPVGERVQPRRDAAWRDDARGERRAFVERAVEL